MSKCPKCKENKMTLIRINPQGQELSVCVRCDWMMLKKKKGVKNA